MAKVLGVLVEHDGREYLVAADAAKLPDLLERSSSGGWMTLKKSRDAKATAAALLSAFGESSGTSNHTQQYIKRLVIFSVNEVIRKFFQKARW